jgi:hypothetical protein
VIPGDHEPRHVHAVVGAGGTAQVVFLLGHDRSVVLPEIRGRLSKADIRSAQAAVADHFDALVAL